MIKWFKNKFKTVYCKDCDNCIPSDGKQDSLTNAGLIVGDGPMCKAYPIEEDCSEIDTFVDKGRRINIIKTFKRCDDIRCHKRFPVVYRSYCFKFIPKNEKILDK